MKRRKLVVGALVLGTGLGLVGVGSTANATAVLPAVELCQQVLAPVTRGALANSDPLGACQWNMIRVGATTNGSSARATGAGVRIGIIDTGVDMTHPDIQPNLDVAASCSYVTPRSLVEADEAASGDCTNKAAVQDFSSHGSNVASLVAAPLNGIGMAGVAPDATIVALKACNQQIGCYADDVTAAVRAAGRLRLDIAVLGAISGSNLITCGTDLQQQAQLKALQDAAYYALTRGVVLIVGAGDSQRDLVRNAADPVLPRPGLTGFLDGTGCRVSTVTLPGAIIVSSVGPTSIAASTNVGRDVDVSAPGGQAGSAETPQLAVYAAATSTPRTGYFTFRRFEDTFYPGTTIIDGSAEYMAIEGSDMAAAHAAGVAALIVQRNPTWGPGAIKRELERTSTPTPCPPAGAHVIPCRGVTGDNTHFGHGVVNTAIRPRT